MCTDLRSVRKTQFIPSSSMEEIQYRKIAVNVLKKLKSQSEDRGTHRDEQHRELESHRRCRSQRLRASTSSKSWNHGGDTANVGTAAQSIVRGGNTLNCPFLAVSNLLLTLSIY